MNKIILSTVFVFGLGATHIFSQIPVGVRLDANTSHFILSNADERGRGNSLRNQRGFGFSMGGFTRIDFSENFALRTELLLHYKTSRMERFESSENFQHSGATFQSFGVEIPFHFIFQTNGRRCFIGTGFYVAYGLGARYRFDGGNNLSLYRGNNAELNRLDFGIASIIGHQFLGRRLQLVITCKVGLSNLLNANRDSARMRIHTLSVGLGYTLNPGRESCNRSCSACRRKDRCRMR
ncbi:MAG: PorT family protein [Bacteroidales bacterium]|nr:PorT family protein [Bacteroidales bacterium]